MTVPLLLKVGVVVGLFTAEVRYVTNNTERHVRVVERELQEPKQLYYETLRRNYDLHNELKKIMEASK